ncbi:serine hydrolase domain-containing protein [Alteromonas lipolytica]|uniref:Beta-lactamase-related domain-containing protein n=1 Tax=Alteromonas lipolytica TaxID=1856405 RepID=A0A1E8FIQ0_9ALTE|nr:serine hydrolase [Alteromonas lipolytica]OFI35820.1 hypothetical protein BFC17_11100 [Alteromonas lipolytica]GGF81109.1 hypothetical protein GCM10011338_36650 [Alteromonas lipolytica]
MSYLRFIFAILAMFSLHFAVAAPDDRFATLDKYLQDSVANGFSGAVLVVEAGDVRLNQGYGLAVRDAHLPVTAETLFDIGSVTKQFTAAAIMHLAQQGKLTTSMTLADFFADVPPDKQGITLHQLLSHSAGIANGIGARDFEHIPTQTFFARLFNEPLYFAPGEGYAYSNAGYSILARIIELVSGQPYESYVQSALFAPAGMQHTGYLKPELRQEPAAAGYLFGEADTGSTRDRYFADAAIAWPLKGNGGILSTLNDMYLWSQALQTNRILKDQYRQQLFSPHVAEDEEGSSHYGYGWAIMKTPRDTRFIGHNGSNGVFYFDFRWFPDEQSLILFASNAMVESTMAVPFYIEQYLFEQEPLPEFTRGLTSEIVRKSVTTAGNALHKKAVLQKTFISRVDDKRILNRAGLRLLDQQLFADAIALLSLNVELFSDDGNLWDSLGEAYFESGQAEAAKSAFKRALQLKPAQDCFWCENSQTRLQQLLNPQ